MDEQEELAADSDFDRTFGIVDTCSTAEGESTSSSSSTAPGLVPFIYTVATAVTLSCASLSVNFYMDGSIY